MPSSLDTLRALPTNDLNHYLEIHFFRPTWTFLITEVILIWKKFLIIWLLSTSTSSLTFSEQMSLLGSVALWLSLNSQSISSQIRQRCMFLWAAFKSHTNWCNAQRVRTPTTTILQTTLSTFSRPVQLRLSDLRVANYRVLPKYCKTVDSYKCF